jgi:hypothetical protein
MDNIALLVPATSNMRLYRSFKDTDLYNYLFKSFFTTYDQNYNYTIYLGLDSDDEFYNNPEVRYEIIKYVSVMRNTDVKFYYLNKSYKGDPAGIWTYLFKEALKDNDYFIQVGSDIHFTDKGWVSQSIEVLKEHNNLGVVGLSDLGRLTFNPNDKLLTQSIVSKLHYDIFTFYFPPEIKNWCCDDWITDIYEAHNLVYRIDKGFYNLGGNPRYKVPENYKNQYDLALQKYSNNILDFKKVKTYIKWIERKN